MNWDDIGFLVSKNKYNENSLISEIFTRDHGKVSGVIFGGTSKKIKNYLQIGNKLYVNYNSKSDNKIGYFKIEISQALSPIYFDDIQKLSCMTTAMNLIKILTAEYQSNRKIYDLIEKFYLILKSENWLKEYIFWELELFKNLGYSLDFKNLVDKKMVGNELQYISKSSIDKKIIPNFLIDKNNNPESLKVLLSGLKIVSDFLEKTILRPNNIKLPISRLNFINTLK